eukprot:5900445-Amphidinium_carterae.1
MNVTSHSLPANRATREMVDGHQDMQCWASPDCLKYLSGTKKAHLSKKVLLELSIGTAWHRSTWEP